MWLAGEKARKSWRQSTHTKYHWLEAKSARDQIALQKCQSRAERVAEELCCTASKFRTEKSCSRHRHGNKKTKSWSATIGASVTLLLYKHLFSREDVRTCWTLFDIHEGTVLGNWNLRCSLQLSCMKCWHICGVKLVCEQWFSFNSSCCTFEYKALQDTSCRTI